jgi:hypothetical protein
VRDVKIDQNLNVTAPGATMCQQFGNVPGPLVEPQALAFGRALDKTSRQSDFR